MNRKQEKLFIVALSVLLAFVGAMAYAGRGDKVGTPAAPELLIPVGSREIALGGSSLSTTSGIEAIYWNPAGVARTSFGTEALFSHMTYIDDIGVEYAAVTSSFSGFGTVGLSIKSLSFGDIEITTEDAPDGTGQTFSPAYLTIGLTYSTLLTDRISVGVTTKLISERIDRVSATGVAFDAGIQYSGFANVAGLSIGVAVKNLGAPMQFDGSGLLREASVEDTRRPASNYKIQASSDELPSVFEFGVGYRYSFEERNAFSFSTLFQNNNFSDDEYKFGLEYGYDNTIFIRGGYNLSQESVQDSYIFGTTLGAGFHYAFSGLDLAIDYAFRDVKFFSSNHTFSLKLGF